MIKNPDKVTNIKKTGSIKKLVKDDHSFILKNYSKSFLSKFRRTKEIRVAKKLRTKENINTPDLIDSNEKEVLFDYVDNIDYVDSIDEKYIAKKLVKFNNTNIDMKRSKTANLLDKLVDKPMAFLQRNLIRKFFSLGLIKYCKIQKVVFGLKKRQKVFDKKLLLHNDFYKNNILITENDEIYFCDLESVVKVDRWIFIDVMKFSFGRPYIRKLNKVFIKAYLEEFKNKYKKELKTT